MKTLLQTLALILFVGTAQAGCLDNIGAYAKEDHMIKAWGIERVSGKTVVFISNIRNFRSIDIRDYGWNNHQARAMEKQFKCKNVVFENAYTDTGVPRWNQ